MQMRAQNDAIINIRIEVYIYMCVKGFVCMILNNNPIDIFCECRKMSSDCNIRLDGICMLHDKLYIYMYRGFWGLYALGKLYTHSLHEHTYPNSGHFHAHVKHLALRLGVRIIASQDLAATREGRTWHIGETVVGRRFVVEELGGDHHAADNSDY